MNHLQQERRRAVCPPYPVQAERRGGCAWQRDSIAGSSKERQADEALVHKAQEGQRAAFDQLVLKYRGRLQRVLSRVTYDQADVQDIVQETFIRAYRGLPTFRHEASFYTWLFQIGINCARNHRMAKMRRAHVSQQIVLNPDESPDEDKAARDNHTPMASLENKQALMALNAVLDAMPTRYSCPLLLCELEGMSYQDIAEVMKCPIGTVRSRIFRARELIAARLAPLIDGVHLPAQRN